MIPIQKEAREMQANRLGWGKETESGYALPALAPLLLSLRSSRALAQTHCLWTCLLLCVLDTAASGRAQGWLIQCPAAPGTYVLETHTCWLLSWF